MYSKVQEQLENVFRDLRIGVDGKKVLDAGAGSGVFTKFYVDHGARVTAVDISEDALRDIRKKCPSASLLCCDLKDLDYVKKESFDVVHCADVLYHITDDEAWRRTIANLARASKRFLILHDRYVRWRPVAGWSHVKARRTAETRDESSKLGFVERGRYATHILYVRFPFVLLANVIPRILGKIDRFLASKGNSQDFASNHLVVLEKLTR
ncbi:MAG: class I SAM-dependent methyltransferase [Candidatus Binatia bacterium]